MTRESWAVVDGPHQGEWFALDIVEGSDVEIPTPNGRMAVYRAKIHRKYFGSPGSDDVSVSESRMLSFVGYVL